MNEPDAKEQVSAFIDGELQVPARGQVVDALYASAELRRTWARFHLIGDAMRGARPVPGAGTIAGRVSAALSGERIVALKPRVRRPGIAPLAGLALAASVSVVAVLGIHGLGGDHTQSSLVADGARPEGTATDAVAAGSDRAAQPARREPARLQWSDVAPDTEARLNAYLVNHNEYAGHGVRGMPPYVRLVGYQSVAGDYR